MAAQRRVGLFKRQPDGFKDAIELPINFEISKPENSISEVGQDFVSNLITQAMFVESMLMAVDLYDEARSPTFEVYDVTCERRLPTEMMAYFAELSEFDPELHLLAGHGFAELAGNLVCHRTPPGRTELGLARVRHQPLRKSHICDLRAATLPEGGEG